MLTEDECRVIAEKMKDTISAAPYATKAEGLQKLKVVQGELVRFQLTDLEQSNASAALRALELCLAVRGAKGEKARQIAREEAHKFAGLHAFQTALREVFNRPKATDSD